MKISILGISSRSLLMRLMVAHVLGTLYAYMVYLERRLSRKEIKGMMEGAGLVDIHFSSGEPYWCVVGSKTK